MTYTPYTQEAKRIEAGLQCPECFGTNVQCRYSPFTKQADPARFHCNSCGCNWSKRQ